MLAAGFLAPFLADRLSRWMVVPSVVLELLLGVLLGPVVLGWARPGDVVTVMSDLGLSMLMFLAGYEVDFARIRGRPLRLAVTCWLVSLTGGLLIAGGIVGLLAGGAADDLVAHRSAAALVVGLAITTTALGTILPPVRDAGLLPTVLGGQIMAVGALGEFGPIVAVALLLTSDQPGRTAVLLVAFAVLAVCGVWLATRHRPPRFARLIASTLNTSTQVAVRLAMLVVVFMVWAALAFGLDSLLGAFSAGIIVKAFLGTGSHDEESVVASKLEGIGFGFLVPFFFVMSGVTLDIRALLTSPVDALMVPLFVLLFLLVRGVPTLVLYRREQVVGAERRALALFAATQLPLVVVITSLGVNNGAIKASTAAALVTAGVLSVLIFPMIALRLAGQPVATSTEVALGSPADVLLRSPGDVDRGSPPGVVPGSPADVGPGSPPDADAPWPWAAAVPPPRDVPPLATPGSPPVSPPAPPGATD